jgi:hypothetical protein
MSVIEINPTAADQPVEMTDLFSLNGVTYQVPAKPRLNLALRYLKARRESGEMEAASLLLEQMVGGEGFDALMNYDDLTPEILEQVTTAAAKLAMGGLEKSLGNSHSGPRS